MIELPEMTLDKLIPFFESLPPERYDTTCGSSGHYILAHYALAHLSATSALVSPGDQIVEWFLNEKTFGRELTNAEQALAIEYDKWGEQHMLQADTNEQYQPTNAAVVAWLKEYQREQA